MEPTERLVLFLDEALKVERQRVDKLLAIVDKFHSVQNVNVPRETKQAEPVVIPEPDIPPNVVLAAIKQISPQRDRTYEANYAYWERNKERAALHAEAFAQEILEGQTFEPAPAEVVTEETDEVQGTA